VLEAVEKEPQIHGGRKEWRYFAGREEVAGLEAQALTVGQILGDGIDAEHPSGQAAHVAEAVTSAEADLADGESVHADSGGFQPRKQRRHLETTHIRLVVAPKRRIVAVVRGLRPERIEIPEGPAYRARSAEAISRLERRVVGAERRR
jgi:hypothetical protein